MHTVMHYSVDSDYVTSHVRSVSGQAYVQDPVYSGACSWYTSLGPCH